MGDSRVRLMWSHTSAILCLIANVNRDPKKTSAFKPSDFDPTAKRREGSRPSVKISDLKHLLKDLNGKRARD